MILSSTSAPVQMSGSLQVSEFTIKNSRKSFQLLSSGLYSNKIRAVIRELYCNALDSHRAAGQSRPPTLHLPTRMEPWFSIRDYGTGLDDQEISGSWVSVPTYDSAGFVNYDDSGNPIMTQIRRGGIYNTYFESTKTESNDYIGALGLGSKSPFSYTDNFTVTAIKNGIKRIYTAYIGDSGTPSVTMMHEEPSEEATGVEVLMAVTESGDFQKFRDEFHAVIRWVKEKPEVTGDTSVEVPDMEYLIRDLVPGVHVLSGNTSARSYALMGNIAYPMNDMPNAHSHLGKNSELLTAGLVFEFGIGELDFSASRESLSYIPVTIDSIVRRVNETVSQMGSYLTKQIQGKSVFESLAHLDTIARSNSWARIAVYDFVSADPVLKDATVPGHIGSMKTPLKELESAGYELTRYQRPYYSYRSRSRWTGSRIDVSSSNHMVSVRGDHRFLADDYGTGLAGLITTSVTSKISGSVDTVFVVRKTSGARCDASDVDAISKIMNGMPVMAASTIFGQPNVTRTRAKLNVVHQFSEFTTYYGCAARWRSISVDKFPAGQRAPYVEISANSLKSSNDAALIRQITARDLHGLYTGPIYGVRDSGKPYIKGLDLVPLREFVEELIQSIPRESVIKYALSQSMDGRGIEWLVKHRPNLFNLPSVPTLTASVYPDAALARTSHYREIISEIDESVNEAYRRYPLLKYTQGQPYSQELLDYVELVDQALSQKPQQTN